MDGKQNLRKSASEGRRSRLPVDLSAVLQPVLDGARQIASYVGYGSEPFVPPRPGWLLPVLLADGDLDWAAYDGELARGRRGLLEPVGPRLGVGAIATCDVLLVPALLVDRSGNRLGKGGGSYDRALLRATGLIIALLHEQEFVETVPYSDHDVPVQAVATPVGGLVILV